MVYRKPMWPLAAIAMLLFTVAACGGGETAGTPAASTPGATSILSPLATPTSAASPSPTQPAGGEQPLVVDLASVDPLLTIYAVDLGDLRNDITSVAVGDFNDDGIGDLLIGARFGDGPDNSRDKAGEAYVIFGSPALGGTVDLAQGEQDITIFGAKPGDNLGFSVAAADVNNDGTDDIIVSAPMSEGPETDYRTDRGEVYIIFGRSDLGGLVDMADSPQDVTVIAAEGFSLLGDSIAIADVNGDDIEDLILGAPFAGRVPGSPPGGPRTQLGEVYVVFGSPDLAGEVRIPQGQQDFTISGPHRFSELGDAMAAGDVNGDGIGDIIAVAEAADAAGGTRANAGQTYVIFGSSDLGGLSDIAEGQEDLTVDGAEDNDALGFCATSGDINGDGVDDIVLVAQRADAPGSSKQTCGVAYVIFGSDDLKGTIDVLKYDQDMTIVGADSHNLLSSCSAGHDLNGDGIGDLVLGTGFARGPDNGREGGGEAYIIFGSPDLKGILDLALASYDVILFGAEVDDRFGTGIAAGDVNGDGQEELIVVASAADGPQNARADAGEIYVITDLRRP